MKKLLSFVCFSFCVQVSCILAQTNNTKMHFKHFSVTEGLSQSWVLSIVQDSLGFMWFATDDGLNRFDGYSFKVFKHNPKNSASLLNNSIKCLELDKNNRLWIGTITGLCCYSMETDDFSYSNNWPSEHISAMAFTDNLLFIGTISNLFVMNTEEKHPVFKPVDANKIPIGVNVNSIAIDKKENIWVVSKRGLFVLKKNKDGAYKVWEELPFQKEFSEQDIVSVEVDNFNRIWLGKTDGTLCLIESKGDLTNATLKKFIHSRNNPASLTKGNINSLKADKKGNLWIGIENCGLDFLDISMPDIRLPRFNHYCNDPNDENSISSNSIYAFWEDLRGDIWIGTYAGGINYYNSSGENFVHVKSISDKANSLVNNNVNVFYEFENYIWIGTEGGLSRYSKADHTFINYTSGYRGSNTISANAVWAITKYEPGTLLIGTWLGGVDIFDTHTGRFSNFLPDRISSKKIFALHVDSKGVLWIGTMGGGLNIYDKQTGLFETFRNDIDDPNSISSDWIRYIYETRNGEMWISTTQSVELFDKKNKRFIHFAPRTNDTTSLSGNGADIIFEDSKNNLWFGTQVGLNYFVRSDSSFIYYQEDDGLPNNAIKGILEDDHGNLWISTNKGISKMIQGVNLPEYPVFINFDYSDGLQGNEFNRRAAFRGKDGKMYFGGTKGFNVFHPDSIFENEYIPPVVITNFLVFNKPYEDKGNIKHISIRDKVVLKYNQSVFCFEFSALNFVNSNKNEYAYFLEGFDKKWNEIGSQRQATYTNIPPGEYIFKVKASNNDGIWNEDGVQIKVIIRPPWYRTILAYSVYFTIIILLVLGFRRMILIRAHLKHEVAMKQIEKEKLDEVHTLKSRFFANISHEFRTPLTLIISPLDKLLASRDFSADLKYQLKMILNNARRMLRLINQFLDISKIEAGYLKMEVHEGDLVKYILAIGEMFRYQAEEKSLKYTIHSNLYSFQAWFDSDKIEKIFYNLLSNAMKFTPVGGEVKIRIQVNSPDSPGVEYPGYFEIWIEDTGIGIKEQEKGRIFDRFYQADGTVSNRNAGSGIGLSHVYGLVQKYGGFIDFKSEYEKGTTFYLRLPIDKNLFDNATIITKSEEEYFEKVQQDYFDDFQTNVHLETEMKMEGISSNNLPILLIIDDNPELRDYIRSHFKTTYKILEASDGKQGLEIAIEGHPDIIITDIMMPEINGIQLTRLLKTDEQTSHIPIILLTAKVSDESQIEGLETGADSFITKPFSISVLEASIKNLLENRKKLKQIFSQNIQIKPTDISVTSVDALFIQKSMSLVDKNLSNPDFNVYNMSKEIGMSRALLHRKMVALTGMPPSNFIKVMRLKRAAHLLVAGQITVSEVIYEIGIKSRSYFTRSFKEMYGVSPMKYVENENNKSK